MIFHLTAPLDQVRHDPAAVFTAGLKLHHLANTAYPIGHLTTMRPYRLSNTEAQVSAPQAWRGIDRLGLYVHIPFCESRCGYCEYCVVPQEEFHRNEDEYFRLLQREFELNRLALDTPPKTLIGFDIGGGTPSAAKVEHIAGVVEIARRCFHLPETTTISIETTPRIAALYPEKIQAFYDMGIRRVSMGVQTVNPRLLQSVGREHTSLAYNLSAAEAIHKAGFKKFNIDVMYGFAGQALSSVEATLRHVISLQPEYITLYRMRYKGTRLADHAQRVSLKEVNAQYRLANEMLGEAGFLGTPGKNTFSRLEGDPGTSNYLTERVIYGTPYLGLGLGAQSLSQHTLAYNAGAADKRLDHYRKMVNAGKLPIQDLYHLSLEAAMAKMISVSFYFGEVHLLGFQHKFGVRLEDAFPDEVMYVLTNGLMEYIPREALSLRLTPHGVDHYNGVIALFYAGAVKQLLLNLATSRVHFRSDLHFDRQDQPALEESHVIPYTL